MKPIIFVLGPSGVGKSCVSKSLKKECSFLHLDLHSKSGSFKANGFPDEWEEDISKINFAELAAIVRRHPSIEQHAAAVLSFPTVHVFTPQQLKDASHIGIFTVVLWGTEERCLEARRERQTERTGSFDEGQVKRYRRKNRRTFETYACSGYAEFRVEAFQPNGSRWPLNRFLELILERLAKQGFPRTMEKDGHSR